MQLSIGFPDFESEKSLLMNGNTEHKLQTVIDTDALKLLQQEVRSISVSESVLEYILHLVNHTRKSKEFPNPLSPRASKALLNTAKAAAFVNGRAFVIPEDVQLILPGVCEHRLRGSTHIKSSHSYSEYLLQQVDPLAA